jgi:hypothetical protein
MRKRAGFLCLAMVLLPAVAATAEDEAAVRELEQRCEAVREAKLKPLRDAEIERCIEDQRREADYCHRYWSDYGNAVRLPNGRFRPRMFDDLPECVAAHKARRDLNMK